MVQQENDRKIKDALDNLPDLPNGVSWNTEKGWNKFAEKYKQGKNLHMVRWLLVAAAITLVVVVVKSVLYQKSTENKIIEISTTDNQKKELELWDGTTIWLNSNTSLIVDTLQKEINIEGEAYFEFSDRNTFTLASPHGKYMTQGGCFNLRSRTKDEGALLIVDKNHVSILWDNDVKYVSVVDSGIKAKIVPCVAIIKVTNDDPNYLAWKTGELHFTNTPMYCIIEKLEELNNTIINVSNKNIRYCRVSSDFKTLAANSVLIELTQYLNFRIENEPKGYRLIGDGCNMF